MDVYVIEETRINGINYLLVADGPEDSDEVEAFILKDCSDESDADAVYETVDDEEELESVMKIFSELMDDVNLELE